MSTDIRPEISPNNKYWIEKHRYYELKHFCLQYPLWNMRIIRLTGLAKYLSMLRRSQNRIITVIRFPSVRDTNILC